SYQSSNTFTVPDGTFPVVVRDAHQCTATTSVVVGRIDNMFLSIAPRDTTICVGQSVPFITTSNPGITTFTWSSWNASPNTIDSITLKDATVTPVDTASYILHAQLGVCERWDSTRVFVLHKPKAHAGPDAGICFGSR